MDNFGEKKIMFDHPSRQLSTIKLTKKTIYNSQLDKLKNLILKALKLILTVEFGIHFQNKSKVFFLMNL